ncbi:MAG: hypothetical protein NC253_00755 [Ruminococcus sp.]|nr:hypothetical protein [Ruminococcus sp.]MCM1382384.1 hypothetical protein [Muribaculaceae bacterium]MCM1478570.1 hypothetical protein [Muribaculaceae bacterium]
MKIFKKAADYWDSHKNVPLFKGKVLAVIMLIAAIIVNFAVGTEDKADSNNSSSSTSVSEEKEEPKEYELHIGTSNIIMLGVGIAALAAVKIKREKDLNGRHDKVEKNHKED